MHRPKPSYACLGFFDGALGLLQFLSDGGLSFINRDRARTETMHEFVHQDVREKCVEGGFGLCGWM